MSVPMLSLKLSKALASRRWRDLPSIDEYIEQRNDIQLRAESLSKELADLCWIELGVANRHIERVVDEVLPLRFVENEIARCLERVRNDNRFKMREPEA
jgi:hypothetical protein